MSYDSILLDVAGSVATITLNRPEKLNAFTRQMGAELIDALDRTDADDEVRVVVVTGAGRAFCAGADLSVGGSRFDHGDCQEEVTRDRGGELTLRLFDSKKPVIGAINGPCVGVGATMTLAMDVRLASDSARFSFPFTRRGVVPESCSSWFLPRLVGVSKALEWFYSGSMISSADALSAGLIRSTHPDEELFCAVDDIAGEIAVNTAPVSVALARQLTWRMLGADHPMRAHIAESRGMSAQGASSDAQEGINSFLEKRPPDFVRHVGTDLPDIFPGWVEPEFR